MAIASLPMYELPAMRAANDAWWAGLARAFRREGIPDVPDTLARPDDFRAVWTDPTLLLSQTCGYPLIHGFDGRLTPVAVPCYDLPEPVGHDYYSLIIARADDTAPDIEDFRGGVAAINNWDSQSGMSALRHSVAPHARAGRFFARVVETGGHRHSMAAVAKGEADIAAIDAVTYSLVERHEPERLQGLRVLGSTIRAPGLPYVTRASADGDLVRRLRAGLLSAAADPDLAPARDVLRITGIVPIDRADYARIDAIEREAMEAGYPVLA